MDKEIELKGQSGDPVTDEIDLRHYLGILWKRRFIVAAVAAAAVLLVGAMTISTPPVYEAEAMLLVSGFPAETLVAYARSASTVRRIELAGSGAAAGTGRVMRLSARRINSTSLVSLQVRATDPKRAATLANHWANTIIADSNRLFTSAIVTVAAEAFVPDSPLSSRLTSNLILAAMVGLLFGPLLAFLVEALRPAPIKATGEMRSGEIAHGEGIRSSESPRP